MAGSSVSYDVFSARDIADAAGVHVRDIDAMLASGAVPTIDGRFVEVDDAVAVVRSLRHGTTLPLLAPALFQQAFVDRREAGMPVAGSVLVHAVMIGGLALLVTSGPVAQRRAAGVDATHVVFLALPGPGGGGGGGGLRQALPPPAAELRGASRMRSPISTSRAIRGPETKTRPAPAVIPQPVPRPAEPAPPVTDPTPAPPVVAPIATLEADARDRAGLATDDRTSSDSRGSGRNGGVGAGSGTGLGSGDGAGVGEGAGGGTGGGPYRPGSGVTPPALVREVKPDYTEEARRRGLSGDVELEIVVRRDGSVGSVRLLRGLGAGLEQRAIEAVRQWQFAPGRRLGTAVDVLVEVAVEFRLR